MSKLRMFDMKGQDAGEYELADELLAVGSGDQAVHDAIVAYRAGLRAGTASTKGKGAVAGSNKKPWKQKGTGRARAGYRRSPVWRGGGVAQGPHPRAFDQRIPKRVVRLAFRRAFSVKAAGGGVRVLSELSLAEPKTKALTTLMKALGLQGAVLFVVDRLETNLTLASRNLPDVEVTTARYVNTYQLLQYPVVIFTKLAADALKGRLEDRTGRAA